MARDEAMTSPPLPLPAGELIDRRYSCRTYLEKPVADDDRRRLLEFMATRTQGPLGAQARFGLLAATPGDPRALRRLGTYGFIKGATGYIAGAVRRAPRDLEDYGYLLEEVILFATGIGLGTCWLGGTFTRSTFVRRFGGLERGETMPAVVSTGYIGDDGTERIREREEGDRRFPGGELFFERRYGEPLAAASADGYAAALEAVRMAPSATNRQPWRIVRAGRDWHFLLRRTRGYGKGSPRSSCCASPTCNASTSASPCATSPWSHGSPGSRDDGWWRIRAGAARPRRRVHGDVARRLNRPSADERLLGRSAEAVDWYR